MVFLLGVNYPDRMLVRKVLTSLYGISANSKAFMARPPASPPLSAFKDRAVSDNPSAWAASYTPDSLAKSASPSQPQAQGQGQAQAQARSQTQGKGKGKGKGSDDDKGTAEAIADARTRMPNVPAQQRFCLLSRLLAQHHIHATARLGDLSQTDINGLTASLTQETIENELKREVRQNILRLRDMGTYRGRRHALNLPVRGQRTRSQIITARKFNKVVWRN